MAKEPLDLIVHLGDYIYEYKSTDNRPRRHNSDELNSLESYRNRYAQYKLDPLLKAAHALCPWLVVWDDHEFDNNYAGLISEERNIDPAAFATRRANAYQAFYEHLPMRSSCLPKGPDAQIYRRITYGQLINFEMLDTRQYRTDQPNGDGNKPITDDVLRPDATLLGDAQERWLMSELLQSTSQWNVLAQQVLMARVDRTAGTNRNFSMDQWAGYDAARTRLLRFISERKIPNPIVLTGDIHSNWANDLKIDFDRPEEPTVATEFAGTSISSGGNGAESPATLSQTLSENPFVHFHNTERGYVSCEVTPEAWHTHYRTVPYIAQPGAPLQTRRSFTVENGKPGITS
jgi:alkaline phosphatase D